MVRRSFGDKYAGAEADAGAWSTEWRTMDPSHTALPDGAILRPGTPPDRQILAESLARAREMAAARQATAEHAAKKLEAMELPTRGRHGDDIHGVRAACAELERAPRISPQAAKELEGRGDEDERLTTQDRAALRRHAFEQLRPDYAVDRETSPEVGAGLARRAQELHAMFRDDVSIRNRTIALGLLAKRDDGGRIGSAVMLATCSGDNWRYEAQKEAARQMGAQVMSPVVAKEHAENAHPPVRARERVRGEGGRPQPPDVRDLQRGGGPRSGRSEAGAIAGSRRIAALPRTSRPAPESSHRMKDPSHDPGIER